MSSQRSLSKLWRKSLNAEYYAAESDVTSSSRDRKSVRSMMTPSSSNMSSSHTHPPAPHLSAFANNNNNNNHNGSRSHNTNNSCIKNKYDFNLNNHIIKQYHMSVMRNSCGSRDKIMSEANLRRSYHFDAAAAAANTPPISSRKTPELYDNLV